MTAVPSVADFSVPQDIKMAFSKSPVKKHSQKEEEEKILSLRSTFVLELCSPEVNKKEAMAARSPY